MSFIKDHINRDSLSQFARFCIIGVVATLIHYVVYFALLKGLHVEKEIWINVVYTVGYVISWFCNFWLTAHYTFNTTINFKRGIGFAVSHGINYLLHIVLLNMFLWLGLSTIVAPLLVFCCVIPVNFILVRTVFRKL